MDSLGVCVIVSLMNWCRNALFDMWLGIVSSLSMAHFSRMQSSKLISIGNDAFTSLQHSSVGQFSWLRSTQSAQTFHHIEVLFPTWTNQVCKLQSSLSRVISCSDVKSSNVSNWGMNYDSSSSSHIPSLASFNVVLSMSSSIVNFFFLLTCFLSSF